MPRGLVDGNGGAWWWVGIEVEVEVIAAVMTVVRVVQVSDGGRSRD